jgi:hypothetical protein
MKNGWIRAIGIAIATATIVSATSTPAWALPSPVRPRVLSRPAAFGRAATPPAPALRPVVSRAIHSDRSPALTSIAPARAASPSLAETVVPLHRLPRRGAAQSATSAPGADLPEANVPGVYAPGAYTPSMPAPSLSFDGIRSGDNSNFAVPPDPNGDVGPNHYVQIVNLSFAVYSKTNGALIYGPVSTNLLWSGFGGYCEATNSGDPIVLYDSLADRWLISQFSLPSGYGPFLQCIAVSATPDPAGSYYRYAYTMPNGKMNDYAKWGIWPDGYYMTVNQYTNATNSGAWAGAGVFAFDRAGMLAGNSSAASVYFDLWDVDHNFGGILPADLDGPIPPPSGAPDYFAEVDSAAWSTPTSAIRLWQFHVDWADAENATFGLGGTGQPNAILAVQPFAYLDCAFVYPPSCIPQRGVSQKVDAVGDRAMYRLVYRNYGSHEVLAFNHTISATAGADSGIAGVRWYEIRNPGSAPSIYQQGTYAPDNVYRWMGSLALDRDGNLALGYSASSESVYPSIRYAGRLASDPPGTLPQGEVTLQEGGGSQTTAYLRWGDYTAMSIDPSDDCTFWYTNEYYPSTSDRSWYTRIGAFKFPSCSPEGQGALTGTVMEAASGVPIAGAQVLAVLGPTASFSAATNLSGTYALLLPAGTYTLSASAYGYTTSVVAGVSLSSAFTVTRNFALAPLPRYTVSGTVTDRRSGAPLAATLQVAGWPLDPPLTSTTTSLATGAYSLTLLAGQSYTLTASSPFHASAVQPLGMLTHDITASFALTATLLHYFPIWYR